MIFRGGGQNFNGKGYCDVHAKQVQGGPMFGPRAPIDPGTFTLALVYIFSISSSCLEAALASVGLSLAVSFPQSVDDSFHPRNT